MTVAAEASSPGRQTRSGARTWRLPWLDVALCGLLVLVAGLARLPNLDLYTISFPEGIRAAQLQLMAAGYRPCVEIFCNQGPLLFYAIYPTYALLGGSLEAVRSGVVIFSLVGIAATYWVGHLFGGRTGAVIAALLVALSPTYLKFSRLALAEVPAEAPAILAVGAAIVFQRSGRDRWLLGAALLTAFSLLLKPVTLAVCAPVGLAVLLRSERRWRNVAVLIGVTALGIGIPTVLIGFSEILEQVVAFRLRSREAEGRGIGWNWGRIVEELSADRAGLFAFAVAGGIVMLGRLRSAAIPLVAWLPASLLLLLVHTPLHGKHIVTLIPPAAVLAAIGVVLVAPAVPAVVAQVQHLVGSRPGTGRTASRSGRRSLAPRLGVALVTAGLVLYLWNLPPVLARDADLLFDPDPLENDPPAYWYPEVAATLREVIDQDEMVVTDHPYLTFRAGRLVPPPLVESSVTRVLAGSLTPDDFIAEATRYDAQAILLWADKITTMREVKSWVDKSYVAVRAYAADEEAIPTLYVRPDRAARAASSLGALTPRAVDADFEGGIRLRRFGVDHSRLDPGGVSAVNVELVATARPPVSYRAVFQLRGEDGVRRLEERRAGGRRAGTGLGELGRGTDDVAGCADPDPALGEDRGVQPLDAAVRPARPALRRLVERLAEPGRADPKGVTLTTIRIGPETATMP